MGEVYRANDPLANHHQACVSPPSPTPLRFVQHASLRNVKSSQ